jgi:hypothetical protein
VSDNSDNVLGYSFYDIHAKVSTDIGTRDRLMVSMYYGNDQLSTGNDPKLSSENDGITWGNRVASLRWNHQYSGKLFSNTSLSYSNYRTRAAFGSFDINGAVNSSIIQSVISDITLKTDIDYWPTGFQRIRTGAGVTRQFFMPSTAYQSVSGTIENKNNSTANQLFAYSEYDVDITSRLHVTGGARLSAYQNTTRYVRLEPRMNILYSFKKNWSLNMSYALMNQYVHLISTFNGLGLPSDIWMNTDEQIQPQRSQQINAGFLKRNILYSSISFSVEGYYKQIEQMAVLREGASFFQLVPFTPNQPIVNDWRTLLTQGACQSYGLEFLLKKEGQKTTGWISYTLSKTALTVPDINRGRTYPANYDRRHDLGIYIHYKAGKHLSLSANWLYGSGYPISLPVGEYIPESHNLNSGTGSYGGTRYDIEEKNGYRMNSYHRLDISLQYNHLIGKKVKSTFELSAFNVYNRANAFYYQIDFKDNSNASSERVLKKTSLFSILPSLSWTLQF